MCGQVECGRATETYHFRTEAELSARLLYSVVTAREYSTEHVWNLVMLHAFAVVLSNKIGTTIVSGCWRFNLMRTLLRYITHPPDP